jgi:simple sugar transport system ATP-binding protein
MVLLMKRFTCSHACQFSYGIFITHKLNEVMNVCHRITVLRHGKVVSTVQAENSDKKTLARMMVGREVLFHIEKTEKTPGRAVLNVEHLSVLNDKGLQAVRDVSFAVHEGEVLGIAGVSGNGQRELIEAINGLRRVEMGQVLFEGHKITNAPPQQIVACGVGYIPEDRLHVGLATGLPIPDNLALKSAERFSSGWFLNHRKMYTYAETLVRDFDVRTPSIRLPVGRLSGGNIQKLILAREIAREPKLLIASQPTRGLDVGAIEYVQKTLLEQRRQGKAILLVSENLDETLHLSDRIAVLYEGRIVGIVSPKTTDRRKIGLMMAGGHG